MNKTLIGKNDYLFLMNDPGQELKIHCDNLNLVSDKNLTRYNFNNFFITIFPNKSYLYKQYLPDTYNIQYRPSFETYKNKFNEKLFDTYEILKNEKSTYYKTDTHINLKGNYIVYKEFINKINKLFNLNILSKKIIINKTLCILNKLPDAIGDLTWPINLGDQEIYDIYDEYYLSNDIMEFYNKYIIINDNHIKFLNYDLTDETFELNKQNKLANWDIISKYIIYAKNINKNNKVLIFYDSFILNILPLYLEMFNEVYMIKTTYNNDLIDIIKPDYVFEFRVERFLF